MMNELLKSVYIVKVILKNKLAHFLWPTMYIHCVSKKPDTCDFFKYL